MLGPLLQIRPARWLAVRRWYLFDVGLAVGLVVASAGQHGDAGVDGWFALAALPLVTGLIIRRWRPLLAFGLAFVGAAIHHLDPAVGLEFLDLAVPLTLYTVASTSRGRRSAAIALASALLGAALVSGFHVFAAAKADAELSASASTQADSTVLVSDAEGNVYRKPVEPPPSPGSMLSEAVGQALSVMLAFGLAFAIGDGVRSRRAHLRAVEQRAADLEREQHQRVALATAAERARISRELHDVVAHGLSVIVVQAQGAATALQRHPDRAAEALQHVIATGRDSLADMRRLLGLVRQDTADDVDDALAPQRGVGALPELVDRVRAAGTPVSLLIDGDPVALPVSVDLSAYRIVQEALTNTIKHAGPGAGVVVRLRFRPDQLDIEAIDDGAGGPAADHGTGLRGIAERVAMLDGEWSAGPAPTKGFRVWAALPLGAPT